MWKCLDNGVTEVEEIIEACKNIEMLDSKDVSRYRWEYNKNKYYDKEVEDMASKTNKKKERAYALLDEGADAKILMNELKISGMAAQKYIDMYNDEKSDGEIKVVLESTKRQVYKLMDNSKPNHKIANCMNLNISVVEDCRQEWIKESKKTLDTESMARILDGEDEIAVIVDFKRAQRQNETQHKKKDEDKEMKEQKSKEVKKLKKVVKYEGDVAIYEPGEDKIKIVIKDTQDAIELKKEQLVELVEEISMLADDIF